MLLKGYEKKNKKTKEEIKKIDSINLIEIHSYIRS